MSKKIEKMKVKKQLVKANHVECHQKFQARIHEAEDSMQAQHLLIEALVDEKDSLLQTIHGLQEANNALAPFDDDWMKVKKQLVKANHVECHQKFQARIHEAEDSMQAQHLLIEALVDEKDSLLQTIHGLQEANNALAPFDDDWEEEPEEEPEEEEIEDIPPGEGEIDDE
ncbi:subunit of the ESCRT-I complex [Dorcoceras hygrometricum]|uniref:Subunit of the ESCRT-I complex n=1 Tax=Dorcoceras hygrometricum TaxID=472368 RepID=A0A2Z7D9G4_9LAMI|nr:subunit of the ESCRT-I complex [Dorcoceras hygrometricum]